MNFPTRQFRLALTVLFLLLAVNFMGAQKLRDGADGALRPVPDGAGGVQQGVFVEDAKPTGGAAVTGNGINYNGGPVMSGTLIKC